MSSPAVRLGGATSGTPTSFREWMRSRSETAPTPASLTAYIQARGPEWWDSERKEAVSDLGDMVGPRKTVAALANRYGGELFLGVTNDGAVVGSPLTWEQIEAGLHQPNATRSTEYVCDLTFAIRVPPVEIPVAEGPPVLRAYVVETLEQALPVFTWDERARHFDLFVRFAGRTRNLGAFETVEWLRERTRSRMLRTLFLEFDTVSRLAVHDQDYSVGFTPVLPYLQTCLEDGTFYTVFSPEDRVALLGRATEGVRSGGSEGFVGGLLRLPKKVEASRRAIESTQPGSTERQLADALWQWYYNTWHDLRRSRDEFRTWVEGQGIRL